MPPVTRAQSAFPHQFVFRGRPFSGRKKEAALAPGIWVYLDVPARSAHLYCLKPKAYLFNYMTVFPGNTMLADMLPETISLMREVFERDPDCTMTTSDTTLMMKPGCGRILR